MKKNLRLSVLAILIGLPIGAALSCATLGTKAADSPGASHEVWTDSASGLTWQLSSTGGGMTWSAAQAHCRSLSLGGRNDWHLPTISELRGLIRGCAATRKGGSCGVTDACVNSSCWNDPCRLGCTNKVGPGPDGVFWPPEITDDVNWYWSSSAVADIDNFAWAVFFDGAIVSFLNVASELGVRCVR